MLLTLFACGGATPIGETIDNGTISITWPARTRDSIPAPGSAMSAQVSIIGGAVGGGNVEVFITRDDNVGLHTGQYPIGQKMTHAPTRFHSVFFSEPNQGGSIVGVADGDIDASGNNAILININLSKAVKSVKVIEPTTVVVSNTPTQLYFEADGEGNVAVPVSLGSGKWTLVSGTGSSLAPDGLLTTNAPGTLVVKVTVDGITSPNKTIIVTEETSGQITFEDLTSSDSYGSFANGSGGQNVVAGGYLTTTNTLDQHAAFWVDGVRQDVHPGGTNKSVINALSGTSGAGNFSPNGSTFHAAIFTPGGYVDLDPTGNYSDALATDGGTQVGQKGRKACRWTSTPESYMDLHPSNWRESYATGVSGTTVVGYISNVPLGGVKAVKWTAPNWDMVDLDPSGSDGSRAHAVSGNKIGGLVYIGNNWHACTWTGTAASMVDLNPSIAGNSNVLGLSGNVAVGYYVNLINDGKPRACIWNGTSSSFIDLNAVLGSEYIYGSEARSISAVPGGYQVAGIAVSKVNGTHGNRVIVWHIPSSALH